LLHLGFAERVKGGHHIFTRDGVAEILNLQEKAGKAKPYQVRQVRAVIVGYGLAGEPDDSSPDQPGDESDEGGGDGN